MAKKKKDVAQRTTGKTSVSRLAPIDNSKVKMPSEIRSTVRARQKDSVAHCKAQAKLMRANCESPEERRRREKVNIRIAKKLGIYEELQELRKIALTRKKRWEKAKARAGAAEFD